MGAHRFIEVESTYAVNPAVPVPDLSLVMGVHTVSQPRTLRLSAVYFDTEDYRLTRSHITLRRRTGGTDDGWHLKLPGSGAGRMEIGAPLSEEVAEDIAPEQLREQVRAITRDRPLRPIAQVDNTRDESELRAEDGSLIAHFCDDHVTAWPLHPTTKHSAHRVGSRQWREWEIELGSAVAGTALGNQVLESADDVVIAAGATDSASPSKLLIAVEEELDDAPTPPQPLVFRKYDERDEAFAGLLTTLIAARDRIIAHDSGARRHDPHALTAMLTATRDLTRVIDMFAELFALERWDEHLESARALSAEFAQLARVLEYTASSHAIAERTTELVAEIAPSLHTDPGIDRLRAETESRLQRAHSRLHKALNSPRYFTALNNLDEFLADPPIPGRLERRKATAIIVRAVKRSYMEVKNQRGSIDAFVAPEATERDHRQVLVALLRSVDTLRTVAAVAVDFTPYDAARLAKEAEKMVAALSQAHTALAVCDLMRNRARSARRRGEDTFVYGVLYQAERHHARHLLHVITHRAKAVRARYKKFKASITA
ncbi:CYTH and CHAD domain-containing protein [Corynebacterium uberis]|uniref:CYTH and CHAD domain-containing protein n=1 Tax=Corynebacterium uberis TaxID=2883169 RepID=UPI001D0AA7D6|nr:CYTH and CHAD domain-containing protein [Corynebacterium uberis]UDL84031.1 CYTH and CHAD domain-containing protein [Corynebacterium uberis]